VADVAHLSEHHVNADEAAQGADYNGREKTVAKKLVLKGEEKIVQVVQNVQAVQIVNNIKTSFPAQTS
jgi:hypothetical protein